MLIEQLPPQLTYLIQEYGNISLFILLALGIFGLPIPEETLLVLAGYLVATKEWYLIPTFLAAIGGSMCGISLSYGLGLTAGNYLIKKYGYLIGINDKKIIYAHYWFERTGKWALFFGYFILGVRHLTGYIAGTTLLSYRKFALFAYTGAVVWVTTFISLGYFFGQRVIITLKEIGFGRWSLIIIMVICLLYGLYRLIKWLRFKSF